MGLTGWSAQIKSQRIWHMIGETEIEDILSQQHHLLVWVSDRLHQLVKYKETPPER
jgi:hypothetical protein